LRAFFKKRFFLSLSSFSHFLERTFALDPRADLALLAQRLPEGRVTVIGDAMLDRFVYGRVSRISPEAPVAVLAVDRDSAVPGGAANVVHNITALGGHAKFVAAIGADRDGDDLKALLTADPNAEPALLEVPGRITTLKTRYIAAGQQLIRADRETAAPLGPEAAENLLTAATAHLAPGAVLVLSDYGKGVLAGETPQHLIKAAAAAGAVVIVDPKGRDFGRYRGADLITPNRKELQEATGMDVSTEEGIVEAAATLLRLHQFGAVLVTRSEDGMSLVTREGAVHFPAEAAEVFDVSGAGDTVIATLSLAMSIGAELPEGARLANIAAGVAVGKVGTATIRPDELLAALNPETGAARKIVSLAAAAEAAERWRQRGWRVGFTNGCFDLLHPGHVHILEQARANCDRLIVGLNADASITRLKGPSRPVQNEHARGKILASLTTVDLVCVFAEDTPLALIEAIRPSLLVKGADYTPETVVGGSFVQSYGGRIMLANLLPGHSTTATVARLRA
jgi:D-beta-D-heptose 7-phosphate kinase/D-beta-D-heptose 1-phosphate adenosyltransferase